MLKDPSKSSGAEQVKKKLCIVCTGPAIDDCEIVILDLESDLKALSDDCEQVDDADPVVLTPIAKLDRDLLGIEAFCVLGSKLYMFEDGYTGIDDSFNIMTTDELKSAYAYDFSSSSSSGVVRLSDMLGPKVFTRAAAPTPDGNIIVVYSSTILYDPCDEDNNVKRIDFELYDAQRDKWDIVPGLAEKVAEKYGRLESNITFHIQAFNFVTNSVILVLISGYLFSLDLDHKPQGVWRFVDVDQSDHVYAKLGDFGGYGEELCLLFGGRMCVSPAAVFDTLNGISFSLPDMSYYDDCVGKSTAHITLLCDDDDSGGEYKFARAYMGLSQETKLPRLVVDVFTFDMCTYINGTGPDECLEIQFVKSSEFVLGNQERVGMGGYGVFPIIAGIDMSSTHEAPEIDMSSTHEAPGIDMSSTHEAPGIDMSSTHEAPGINMSSTHEAPGIDMSSTHEALGINMSSTHEAPRTLSLFRGPSVPYRPDPVGKGLGILL